MSETLSTTMSVNWADIFILGIVAISTVMSFVRGFVKEAISLATWVLAIYVGLQFAPLLAQNLAGQIHTPSVRTVIAFLMLFIAILIIGGLINFLISHLVQKTGLSGTNRLAGSLFGCARGVLMIGVVILLARHTAIPDDPWWKQSTLIAKFEPVADAVSKMLPNKFHKMSQLLLE